MDTLIAESTDGRPKETRSARVVSAVRELAAVSVFLGLINLLANYLLSPFFGIYEDDYMFFVGGQRFATHHDFWNYFRWCFVHPPQGRPLGFALDAAVDYVNQGHSLEFGYVIGWAILTLNAVLIYVVLKRASNWFAALVGAAVYLMLPVDLSKMILMHRVLVEMSMTFLLIGLVLYTTGRLSLKILGFAAAMLCLMDWEGFYLPFVVAPLLEPLPARQRIKNFLPHALIFPIPIAVALAIRYFTGEDRVNAMAHGGLDMFTRMVTAMFLGPTTGISAFLLRPIETITAAQAFPKLVGALAFCLIAAFLWSAGARLSKEPEPGREKAIFLGIAGLIALVFPYILMYRVEYFPANVTIGRLTCCHAPAALGYVSLTALLAYLCWLQFRKIRQVVVLIFSLYLSILIAFGVHIQAAEYVEAWNDQKYIWHRIIEQSADVKPGVTVLVDINGLPETHAFNALWIAGAAAGNVLSRFVQFPKAWENPPLLNLYYPWCEYEVRDDALVLKTPGWVPEDWPVLKDGNFIFFRFEDGDLKRITDPVTLFGKQLTPMAPQPASALKLTRLGQTILGQHTTANWPWLGKALPYSKP